jgi:hypothetical protein
MLKAMDVAEDKIHTDYFPGYDTIWILSSQRIIKPEENFSE